MGQNLYSEYLEGTDVKVLFEKQQVSQYSEYDTLDNYGMDVKLDTNSVYMHHKVLIIDEHIVVTGSFNWSENA